MDVRGFLARVKLTPCRKIWLERYRSLSLQFNFFVLSWAFWCFPCFSGPFKPCSPLVDWDTVCLIRELRILFKQGSYHGMFCIMSALIHPAEFGFYRVVSCMFYDVTVSSCDISISMTVPFRKLLALPQRAVLTNTPRALYRPTASWTSLPNWLEYINKLSTLTTHH